jgi:hypothetical protein
MLVLVLGQVPGAGAGAGAGGPRRSAAAGRAFELPGVGCCAGGPRSAHLVLGLAPGRRRHRVLRAGAAGAARGGRAGVSAWAAAGLAGQLHPTGANARGRSRVRARRRGAGAPLPPRSPAPQHTPQQQHVSLRHAWPARGCFGPGRGARARRRATGSRRARPAAPARSPLLRCARVRPWPTNARELARRVASFVERSSSCARCRARLRARGSDSRRGCSRAKLRCCQSVGWAGGERDVARGLEGLHGARSARRARPGSEPALGLPPPPAYKRAERAPGQRSAAHRLRRTATPPALRHRLGGVWMP